VLVWRLDRWGRSIADLVETLKELNELGVGFGSLTEAFDLGTPTRGQGIDQYPPRWSLGSKFSR
jgi:DNA invertase Pin-like site-specific DNA recombinase